MKTKRYFIPLFLFLFCSVTALAQQPSKRPRMQTSASEQEIVFKPTAEAGKANAGKAVQKETAKKTVKEPRRKKSSDGKERFMALKTNIAYDALAVANLAFEIQCSKHISVELPVMFSGWDVSSEHAVRTFAIQPEGRWWLKAAGAGHFFGVHAHMALFNVKWDENRYQDTGRPLLGAGVSYGYKLPFSRHWGAEFTLGAGYANMKYDTYYNIDNGAKIETKSRNYWGITRVGLSLSYQF